MSTRLHLTCDAMCGAELDTDRIARRFESFSGKGHGFGVWIKPDIDAAVDPTGWVWSDPYTGCTYCPECWAKIENGEEEAA